MIAVICFFSLWVEGEMKVYHEVDGYTMSLHEPNIVVDFGDWARRNKIPLTQYMITVPTNNCLKYVPATKEEIDLDLGQD